MNTNKDGVESGGRGEGRATCESVQTMSACPDEDSCLAGVSTLMNCEERLRQARVSLAHEGTFSQTYSRHVTNTLSQTAARRGCPAVQDDEGSERTGPRQRHNTYWSCYAVCVLDASSIILSPATPSGWKAMIQLESLVFWTLRFQNKSRPKEIEDSCSAEFSQCHVSETTGSSSMCVYVLVNCEK